jgi:hypothetical protein
VPKIFDTFKSDDKLNLAQFLTSGKNTANGMIYFSLEIALRCETRSFYLSKRQFITLVCSNDLSGFL